MKKLTILTVLLGIIFVIAGCSPAEPKERVIVRVPEFESAKPAQGAPADSRGYYIAHKNDNVANAARRYNVSAEELIRFNNLSSPELKEGQIIYIPRGEGPIQKAAEIAPETTFIWPLKGKILTKFGDDLGGFPSEFISIQADYGASVQAAKSGVVNLAYEGDESGRPGMTGFEGYGNFIMISHGKAEFSMYAHFSKIFRKTGDKVTQGETIGSAGSSGRIDSPALRFQIFENGNPVDPLPLLP